MDRGALTRLRNARDDLHGGGDTRDRLWNVWVSYLLALEPRDFAEGDGERFDMLRTRMTLRDGPADGDLRSTLNTMTDEELAEAAWTLSAFLTDVLRREEARA